jgi:hypothetical protein
MADIDIVHPVEGATQVSFDYGAASRALDAYFNMAQVLDNPTVARVGPHDEVVVNWHGYFQGQFDEAWNLLQARFSAGVETANYGPGKIYDAISQANDLQLAWNRNADEARTEPDVPDEPTGPRGAY